MFYKKDIGWIIIIGNLYFHGSRTNNLIALTFDDAPSEETKEILKILKKEKANATFFIIGEKISGYEDIIKEIIDIGSEIGNHTFTHSSLRFKNLFSVKKEIEKTDEKLKQIGIKTDLFRFPNFHFDPFTIILCNLLKKRIIFTDVVSNDYKLSGVDYTVEEVLKKVQNGSIIALHDYLTGLGRNKDIIEITKRLIPALREKGYEFATVSELLNS